MHVQNSDNDEVNGTYNAEELLDNTDEPTGDFSVSLSSNPSATNQVEVGTSIKLTATAKNGQGKVNYAFIGKNGTEKFDIQESSTKQTATWTPDEAGTYTITVEAIDEEDNKSTDSIKITVKDKKDPGTEDPGTEDPGTEDPGKEDKDEITKVVVTSSANSTQVGKTIKLTAKVTGGTGTVYYRFGYIDSNGETKYISNWQTGTTKNWTPTEEGKYKIFVEAKDDNSTKTSSNITINVEKNGGSHKPQETSDTTNALAIGLVSLVSLVSLAGVVSLKRKNK